MLKTRNGFTLVELLIVIVVIGILAAITLVAYNGAQQRGRDAARKSDVAAIAKLYSLYNVEHTPISNGSGCGSSGNGWFNYSNGTSYPTSIMDCLKNSGVTSSTIVDPSGSITCVGGDTGCEAYLIYTCVQSGSTVTYIYANLETWTHTGTELTGTCGSSFSSYGMNYYVKVADA